MDRPEAQSVVRAAARQGQTLRALILTSTPPTSWARAGPPTRPFPLLVKWLDCRERLSLQVHPPAAVAPRAGRRTQDRELVHRRTPRPVRSCSSGCGAASTPRAVRAGDRRRHARGMRAPFPGGGGRLDPGPQRPGARDRRRQPDPRDPAEFRHDLPRVRLGPDRPGRQAAAVAHRRVAALDPLGRLRAARRCAAAPTSG